MQTPRPTIWRRAIVLLTGLLILKVTLSVTLGYVDYFPADFRSDFLLGRESYFWGAYAWAFYAHILAGPITLVLGLVLLSARFRARLPRWHRRLGRVQGALVLVLLVPSGVWMSRYAQGDGTAGSVAGAGFAALAIATGTCVVMGWRAAVRRQFVEHERWMWRCYLLLCSAVALRVIGGLSLVTGAGGEWSYPAAAWASWLAPLTAFEAGRVWKRRRAGRSLRVGGHSAAGESTGSLPAMEISSR